MMWMYNCTYKESLNRKCTDLFLEETRKIKRRSHSDQLKSVDMSRLCTWRFLNFLQEKKSTISFSQHESNYLSSTFYPVSMVPGNYLPL